MACAISSAYFWIRSLPDRRPASNGLVELNYQPVELPSAGGPLRFAGAWRIGADDPRFRGLSSLAMDRGRFLAVSDLGTVIRFDLPGSTAPVADLKGLREGPGPWESKWTRDAESLAPDPAGRGWWIGYEQRHSLWLYDPEFDRAIASIDLDRDDWWDNRGAEAMIADRGNLFVLAENGRDAIRIGPSGTHKLPLEAGADIAEAARSPDGGIWLLLRSVTLGGIRQRLVPLVKVNGRYEVGQGFPLPKARFDNFEGMTIEPLRSGGWRFWLVSDNGRRGIARTLLVAIDYDPPARSGKSPARVTGLSK